MGLASLLQRLLRAPRPGPRRIRTGPIAVGHRVRLRTPIASSHTVWIPAGAAGIVVGGDPTTRVVSIELDTPRTVVTVPWSWIEAEPEKTEDKEDS